VLLTLHKKISNKKAGGLVFKNLILVNFEVIKYEANIKDESYQQKLKYVSY
jgi:hypothetical protein